MSFLVSLSSKFSVSKQKQKRSTLAEENTVFLCTVVSITAAQLNRWTSVHQLKWKSACLLLRNRKAALGS